MKEGVNKSNCPIQNPLLLVTEPWTHDILVSEVAQIGLNNRLDRIIGLNTAAEVILRHY
jgi:hypothetical protein